MENKEITNDVNLIRIIYETKQTKKKNTRKMDKKNLLDTVHVLNGHPQTSQKLTHTHNLLYIR